MKLEFVEIQNFRKLKSCRIDFSDRETLFVGANNSGKTSAMDALILFLKDKSKFTCRDFTLSNWAEVNKIGREWTNLDEEEIPRISIRAWEKYLPSLDIWLKVKKSEVHYVSHIIPTLDWTGGILGVRFRLEPKDLIQTYNEFKEAFFKAQNTRSKVCDNENSLKLWPNDMWEFLERKLSQNFTIRSYILNPELLLPPTNNIANPQELSEEVLPLEGDPLEGLIRIDIIYAQRGFTDPNAENIRSERGIGNLSAQLRDYYRKHLDPYNEPDEADLRALQAIVDAQDSFDKNLEDRFRTSLDELKVLNYPGFGNPNITLSSKINPLDSLNHSSSVLFDLKNDHEDEDSLLLHLPEKYNGLGYQNLISMVFKLIRFRDEWMQTGKASDEQGHEPLHLVLIEEPEAHLHAQVQQVFIKKAYQVLRNNTILKNNKIFSTQLVVSTHSNHIAHEVDFVKIRYFKRNNPSNVLKVPISTVINLSTVFGGEDETTRFAIRYLKTTHCDLFFADAVILIEGSAERILVPHFIINEYKNLSSAYISLLEIGGSHAHRLKPLIETLGLITLIISDIDACDPVKNRIGVQPLKDRGYETGNTTLTKWLPCLKKIDDLLELKEKDKISECSQIRVAYQIPIKLEIADKGVVNPSTFEDALALDNPITFQGLAGSGLLKKFQEALGKTTAKDIGSHMFTAISKEKNKAGFALDLLLKKEPNELHPPKYIAEGLAWLQQKLQKEKGTL